MLLFGLGGLQRRLHYGRDTVKRPVWLGGTILRASAVSTQGAIRGRSHTAPVAGCQRHRLRKQWVMKRLLPNLRSAPRRALSEL